MRLYLKYASIYIKSIMQYKLSFFFTTLGQFLTAFTTFLGVYFMFDRFHAVDGFTYNDILICFSISMMAFSLSECFFRGFDLFSSMISNGEFDRIMLRPKNEIFQVLASKVEITRIGKLFQSIIILIYAVCTINISWTLIKILTVIIMIVSGTAVFSGLLIINASMCFFTTQSLEIMNLFTDGGRELNKYPLSIYGEGVFKFFTFVIPFTCVQYYPLMYLLDRADSIWYMLIPLVGFVFLIPCVILWRIGVRHYKSTGS